MVPLFRCHDKNSVRYRWEVPEQKIGKFLLWAKLSANSNKHLFNLGPAAIKRCLSTLLLLQVRCHPDCRVVVEVTEHACEPPLIVLELQLLWGPDPERCEESPHIRASLFFEGLQGLAHAADNGACRAGRGDGASHIGHCLSGKSQLIARSLL
jgi:hypothetical protein